MVRKKAHFKNKVTGALETYDEDTGELISVSKQTQPTSTKAERVVEVNLPSGQTILVDPKAPGEKEWAYSLELGQKICDALLDGSYIWDICDGVKFPLFKIVSRWRRTYAEFNKILTEAYEDRAELFGDKIREFADKANSGNAVAQNVKINAYKHLAAVDNPKRYQPKASEKAGSLSGAPQTTVIVVTGIIRPGDQPITIETITPKEIESADKSN